MNSANVAFDQADTNRDGSLSQNEFRNFIARNSIVGNDLNSLGVGGTGGYGSSAFQSSAYDASSSGGLGGNLSYNASGLGGAGYGSSSYESSSSYRSSVGNIGGDSSNVNGAGTAGLSAADAASVNFSSTSQSTNMQQYQTDEQGNYKDPSPQVVRRPAQSGPLTYSQNIRVRFLQPPPVPAPGALIIKEVRPPQPPPPPPLRVRQQAPPLPQPPPLILRERPPPRPTTVASQTVVRNLPAIPVPPRSVVIERLPPLPPKPRDIVIERWVPYGAMAKRKTVVQRAEEAKAYPKPQNVIIQYDPPQVRVIRQFQRLGVTPEDPQAYIQRYGASLFDAQTLVQQARAAGVVEDISPPIGSSTVTANATEFSSSSSTTGEVGFDANNLTGIDLGTNIGGGGGGGASRAARSSYFESSSYSSTGDVSGLGASSYESSFGGPGGIDSAFAAADTNRDGVLSQSEFRNAGF